MAIPVSLPMVRGTPLDRGRTYVRVPGRNGVRGLDPRFRFKPTTKRQRAVWGEPRLGEMTDDREASGRSASADCPWFAWPAC